MHGFKGPSYLIHAGSLNIHMEVSHHLRQKLHIAQPTPGLEKVNVLETIDSINFQYEDVFLSIECMQVT